MDPLNGEQPPSSRFLAIGLFEIDRLAEIMLPIIFPMARGEHSFLKEDII